MDSEALPRAAGARIRFDDVNAERSYRSFGRYGETKRT
jgi:hypothetical protein